jgi:hypothetical protein
MLCTRKNVGSQMDLPAASLQLSACLAQLRGREVIANQRPNQSAARSV